MENGLNTNASIIMKNRSQLWEITYERGRVKEVS
jgi:hypothetical protein